MLFAEVEPLSSVEGDLFTPREAARAMGMVPRRRKEFTAARVALKRLARELNLPERHRPNREIETVCPDNLRPCIGESGIHCSVSHSAGLIVVAAHKLPIGVDLERVSKKATRIWRLFMSPEEKDRISVLALGPERTATRAWTLKEAAAKALGLDIFQAIREVHLVSVGEEGGILSYGGKTYPARHVEANGYVITLITLDEVWSSERTGQGGKPYAAIMGPPRAMSS
jgi:phosphopantetheinyl transferase